ncbi:pyridoxal phosphate-dependent aminotransferase [Kallotenue papyrolyticum]|uniref:pyridoxal phosphate-dependent aminotransferase n=1 Tax=Kallotenue papyrolyticum TaxID=1325125 RepID=UPI000492C740|nr:pyridoxal phosphate-dependent aminotransferase [Kallotenue papyrolyticum]
MTGFFAGSDLTPNRIEQVRRQLDGHYIDLTSSNPTQHGLLFPAHVLEAAAASYWNQRRYEPQPRGDARARQAVVDYYAARTPALPLVLDDVFLTASTSEAYSLLFALLTEPGDNVLAPVVTYPLFEYLAELHHIELRPYALDEARGWRIDPASLHAQVDNRTRAVLIVSPHNPTGAIVSEALPALTTLGLPLICDEVFAEFTYRQPTTPPIGALHPELPVFHLNGISKLFALPDLKLGWIALNAAARPFADRLELLNDTFLGANALTQHMLPALFAAGGDFVRAMRERVRCNLDLALERLSACPVLRVHAPDGGYYLFPEVLGCDDEEELVIHCLRHGVRVHPGFFFGYERGVHIMLSCLTRTEQLEAGLTRLLAALAHL